MIKVSREVLAPVAAAAIAAASVSAVAAPVSPALDHTTRDVTLTASQDWITDLWNDVLGLLSPSSEAGTASASTLGDMLSGEVGGVWGSGSTVPDGSDVALVLGPTGVPQPSDEYLQTAYNLYLQPSGLYTGSESDVYSLYTPENSGNTVEGLAADEQHLTAALMPLLQNGDHVTLFGYSQSTAAISTVLNQLTAEYGDKYADQINFVMVGDSASPHGLLNNIYDSLPSWAQQILLENLQGWGLNSEVMNLTGAGYDAPTDITPDGPYQGDVFTLTAGGTDNPAPDGFASWSPDSFTNGDWMSELQGIFSTHIGYFGVDPSDVTQALTGVDPSDAVNYLDLYPSATFLETVTQAAAGVGWIPESTAEFLLSIGL